MNRRLHTTWTLVLLPLLATVPAAAEPSHPSAPPASVGYYAEAGMGATAFLGEAAPYAAVGPGLELGLGRDLTSWFSLGIQMAASTHGATVPPPPEGEYFQLYSAAADARLGFRFGRVGVFVDGRFGGSMMSSNILAKVDILEAGERFSLVYGGGAGVEYQTENRHYAVGLTGHWMSLPQFAGIQGIATRLYLRYTY